MAGFHRHSPFPFLPEPPWIFDAVFSFPDGPLTGNAGWVNSTGPNSSVISTFHLEQKAGVGSSGNLHAVDAAPLSLPMFIAFIASFDGTGSSQLTISFLDNADTALAAVTWNNSNTGVEALVEGVGYAVNGSPTVADGSPHTWLVQLFPGGLVILTVDGIEYINTIGPVGDLSGIVACQILCQNSSSTHRVHLFSMSAGGL